MNYNGQEETRASKFLSRVADRQHAQHTMKKIQQTLFGKKEQLNEPKLPSSEVLFAELQATIEKNEILQTTTEQELYHAQVRVDEANEAKRKAVEEANKTNKTLQEHLEYSTELNASLETERQSYHALLTSTKIIETDLRAKHAELMEEISFQEHRAEDIRESGIRLQSLAEETLRDAGVQTAEAERQVSEMRQSLRDAGAYKLHTTLEQVTSQCNNRENKLKRMIAHLQADKVILTRHATEVGIERDAFKEHLSAVLLDDKSSKKTETTENSEISQKSETLTSSTTSEKDGKLVVEEENRKLRDQNVELQSNARAAEVAMRKAQVETADRGKQLKSLTEITRSTMTEKGRQLVVHMEEENRKLRDQNVDLQSKARNAEAAMRKVQVEVADRDKQLKSMIESQMARTARIDSDTQRTVRVSADNIAAIAGLQFNARAAEAAMQKAKAEIADRDKQLKSMIESQMDRTASQRSTHDSQSVRREKEQSMAPIRSVVTGKILAIKITAREDDIKACRSITGEILAVKVQ